MSSIMQEIGRIAETCGPGGRDLVAAAGRMAEEAHRGQLRASGQPYISHPVAVALILAEETDEPEMLAAALLHDVVEDTPVTGEQLTEAFGEDVGRLVAGVTKLKLLDGRGREGRLHAQDLVAATSGDLRILLLKLCDRLHNMRTLGYLPDEKQQRVAKETWDVYIPLARRTGMMRMAAELEELAFEVLKPQEKEQIERALAPRLPELEAVADRLRRTLPEMLREAGLDEFQIQARVKSPSSIHGKMRATGRAVEQMYDLLAVRILVQDVGACYRALGAVHAAHPPIIGRFLDHIALPKDNLYQSLHTTILVSGETSAEVQIRTFAMHERAEHGFAAHWRYKTETRIGHGRSARLGDQLEELALEELDPGEFLSQMRAELGEEKIVVFTPQGDVLHLPAGATALDMAYLLHTKIGDHAVGAVADGKPINLSDRLQSGSSVLILTDPGRSPGVPAAWIESAVTARARRRLRGRRRQQNDAARTWERGLVDMRLSDRKLLTLLERTARRTGQKDAAALQEAVRDGRVDAEAALNILSEEAGESRRNRKNPT